MCDFFTDLSSTEGESCRNPFVLRVIQEFSPPSPEARVHDIWQPSTGSFLTLHQQSLVQRPDTQAGMTSAQVLHCKSLDNEGLAPVLHKKVTLTLGQNPMLRRRKRRQV